MKIYKLNIQNTNTLEFYKGATFHAPTDKWTDIQMHNYIYLMAPHHTLNIPG